jgi:putative membrane protein insertion efficiency factor
MSPLASVLSALVHVYRWCIAPLLGPRCRFTPGCSSYALEALQTYGAFRGGWLALCRLSRCHPWHLGGYDPVPAPKASHLPCECGKQHP